MSILSRIVAMATAKLIIAPIPAFEFGPSIQFSIAVHNQRFEPKETQDVGFHAQDSGPFQQAVWS